MQPEEHLVKPVLEVLEIVQVVQPQLVPDRNTADPARLDFQSAQSGGRKADNYAWSGGFGQSSFLSRSLRSSSKAIKYKIFGRILARNLRWTRAPMAKA
jgi:hypothetical protein